MILGRGCGWIEGCWGNLALFLTRTTSKMQATVEGTEKGIRIKLADVECGYDVSFIVG
jgi:hypothetical protein